MADQGRKLTIETLATVLRLLAEGRKWVEIQSIAGISKMTISRKVDPDMRAAIKLAFGKDAVRQ